MSLDKTQKLVLGTVQFGLKYGVNNQLGKPSLSKSLEILKYAYDTKILTFDTAFSYGDAEEILGQFVVKNKLANKIKIISKLKPNILDDETKDKTYNIVHWEIEKTLNKLNLKSLEGYLFHTPAYIYNHDLVKAMRQCKKEGLIQNFGVSVYEEKDALYAVKTAKVDYIQVPYSVFDQRLDKTDFFKIAQKNKVRVFARSAFLQGLILMPDTKIPSHLKEAKQYLKTFDAIIGKYHFSRIEAALLFSLSHNGIDDVVFGVDTLSQLKQDINISNQNLDKFKKCREELQSLQSIKKSIIFPSLWKK